jgi:transposase
MSYSSDLRKSVLDFLNNGGSKAEASRIYGVSRTSLYNWLAAEDPLTCQKPGPRGPHRLDYDALKQHVADFPDNTLAERAKHFGVSQHGIFYALTKLNITRKKNANLQRTMPRKTRSLSL